MGSHSPIIQHKSQQIVHAELPLITEDNFYLLVRHITNHVQKLVGNHHIQLLSS